MKAAALYSAAGSLLLTSLAVAPAGGTPATPGAAGAPGTAELRGTVVAAARARAAGIDFGPCSAADMPEAPNSLRCGTVTVPLDYAHPDGKQIELTVSRIRATRKDPDGSERKVPRQGVLVYNPGGPGASGMYFPLIGVIPQWKRIAAAYDLVGYAPRGVDRSAPLSCEDPKHFFKAPSASPTHPSQAYKQQRIARARAYARGCAERSGSGLRHYTSLNNARDLDVLRAALGQDRLTFMGASYGTYFGALYATMFPSHVRRMVLDAPVNPDPEKIWYRDNLDQSAAFEDRWADFRDWIARHDDVYRLGDTPEKVQHSYDSAQKRLAAEAAGGKVGPGQLQNAFLTAAYYDDFWPSRADALSAYLHGDPEPLVRLAAPSPRTAAEAENGSAVYTAVECNDAPWPTDFKVWDRDNTRLARVAPFETWDNAWMNLPCAFWPAPRQQPLDVRTGPGELPPVLILAAERDAAAPYAGALEMNRRLAGSALVTERDAGTHGIGGGPNGCVNAYLDAYLLQGRLPAQHASCAPHREPEPDAPAGRAAVPPSRDSLEDRTVRR
ncbi:alpha/beta hydrolase [Streptomyces pluripotens]|uniref:Alpha/beta hydrolase n=1 Tax=Streptomyces pluripotens TaxID=1355015 RepID=A0A221P4H7_9ACTN|nr:MULTISPECIES: alpha/beta hydrolase [Streptomyces]ARP72935.1 protease [Streptomyces pluripotens]ASN27183.1 alpha/beta hydrolase [Streptomyces pluripotens]KIE28856.1 protease [Streptomyces sp. MUSC 125]MCH0561026.1 alpha/beta fold hydrolase [Streptomyces sp. MUM 16J]